MGGITFLKDEKSGIGFIEKLTEFFLLLYIISVCAFDGKTDTMIITKIAAILLIAFCGLYIFLKHKIRVSYYIVAFVMFIILSFMTLGYNVDISSAITRILTILQILAVSFFIINYLDTDAKIYKSIRFIIYGVIAMYIMLLVRSGGYGAFIQSLNSTTGIRIGAQVNQANDFGVMSSFAGLFALWNALYNKKRIYYLFVILSFVLSMLSGSKKSLLIYLIGFFLLFLFQNNKSKFRNLLIACTGAVFFLYLVYNLPIFSTIADRLNGFFAIFSGNTSTVDASTYARQQLISGGWTAFLQNPILGYGIVGSYAITTGIVGFSTYLHDNFIEILVDSGVIGFIIYYSFYLNITLKLIKEKFDNNLKVLLLIIMLLVILTDTSSVTYFSKFTHLLFSIMAAAILNIKEANLPESKTKNVKNIKFNRLSR